MVFLVSAEYIFFSLHEPECVLAACTFQIKIICSFLLYNAGRESRPKSHPEHANMLQNKVSLCATSVEINDAGKSFCCKIFVSPLGRKTDFRKEEIFFKAFHPVESLRKS
jgi:hypothetical protein